MANNIAFPLPNNLIFANSSFNDFSRFASINKDIINAFITRSDISAQQKMLLQNQLYRISQAARNYTILNRIEYNDLINFLDTQRNALNNYWNTFWRPNSDYRMYYNYYDDYYRNLFGNIYQNNPRNNISQQLATPVAAPVRTSKRLRGENASDLDIGPRQRRQDIITMEPVKEGATITLSDGKKYTLDEVRNMWRFSKIQTPLRHIYTEEDKQKIKRFLDQFKGGKKRTRRGRKRRGTTRKNKK